MPSAPTSDAPASHLTRLTHLLHAFGVDDGEVQLLERPPQDGPPARPVLHGATLLLPAVPSGWHGDGGHCHLAATLHAIGHLLYSPRRQPTGKRKPMGLALAAAIEDVRVDRLLMRRYPGIARLIRHLIRTQNELPQVGFEARIARLQRVLLDPRAGDNDIWVIKGRALFEEQTDQLDDAEAFQPMIDVLAYDLGQLRVRMNLQTHAPPFPWHDDNSHLWAHAADAEQADIPLRRPPPPAGEAGAAAAQTSASPPETVALPEIARHDYPEWHHQLARVRSNWCTVIERAVPPPAPDETGIRTSDNLRLQRGLRLDRRERIRRQWEGEDIDLDAATEVFIDRRLGLAPDPRLFRRAGRAPHHASILLLLDLSASTADLLTDGRSVLALEHEAAGMLMAALRAGSDRLEVAGFDSDGRQAINYLRLLDFGQPIPAEPASLLAFARSGLSTRMGAAIRHATSRLTTERNDTRVLLLLSDGAPSDIDVFDERHLVEDAAFAVGEARRKGIRCFCLTLDRQSEAYVRRIFGRGSYRIIDDAHRLASALRDTCARVVDSS
ncbi:nitric oxide reductase activation protein NorD [Thauera butanivorans]|uniref:nitric oxide reductase activation protein NorD n=1 Tax=Thauera butanivorans TaxID=86174 RepID=UPI000838A26A|nr:hypothetical protein [Thauera butanivorans]